MRRRTLDALLTTGGLALAALLLIAGGLLTWAHTFISDQVTTQLSAQQIFFPPKGEATASPEIGPFINQYAGQQLALIAAIVSFVGAGVMLLLSLLGYAHLRRVNPDEEILAGSHQNKVVTV